MGDKLPRITGMECLRALERDGWQLVRRSGSHVHLKHSTKAGRVTVPKHSGKTLKPRTLLTILEQASMTVERLRELL